MTALALTQEICRNVGEAAPSALSALTGIALLAFNSLNEALMEIATDQHYQPLETLASFEISTASHIFACPTDLMEEDRESFRATNIADLLTFVSPQEFDEAYPKGISSTDTGTPGTLTKIGESFYVNKKASTTASGDRVRFRYWKIPTLLSTATETGTCWIPEGFDRTLLVNYATYKVLHYKNNPEAAAYAAKVQLAWNKFREIKGSPFVSAPFNYIL